MFTYITGDSKDHAILVFHDFMNNTCNEIFIMKSRDDNQDESTKLTEFLFQELKFHPGQATIMQSRP